MAIFNSYVCLPEGNHQSINQSINPINQLTNEAIKFGLHQTTPVTTLRREGPCPLHGPTRPPRDATRPGSCRKQHCRGSEAPFPWPPSQSSEALWAMGFSETGSFISDGSFPLAFSLLLRCLICQLFQLFHLPTLSHKHPGFVEISRSIWNDLRRPPWWSSLGGSRSNDALPDPKMTSSWNSAQTIAVEQKKSLAITSMSTHHISTFSGFSEATSEQSFWIGGHCFLICVFMCVPCFSCQISKVRLGIGVQQSDCHWALGRCAAYGLRLPVAPAHPRARCGNWWKGPKSRVAPGKVSAGNPWFPL